MLYTLDYVTQIKLTNISVTLLYVAYIACISSSCLLPPACNNATYPFLQKKLLTMANKRIQLYASESVIEEFYEAIAANDARKLQRVHIPKSDVFYVRAAIEADTGVRYTLDHVERAMYLEGHLTKYEVLDPSRKRDGVG